MSTRAQYRKAYQVARVYQHQRDIYGNESSALHGLTPAIVAAAYRSLRESTAHDPYATREWEYKRRPNGWLPF